MDFTGRIVLITGAGSGLGRRLAIDLKEAGCRLAMGDFNEAGLVETAAMLKGPETDIYYLKTDVPI